MRSNSIRTRIMKTAAVAVMGFAMIAGGATAAQASGPATTDDVSVQTCLGTGGGIHCFGYTALANGNTKCYSDYRHDTKRHAAIVSGGGKSATTYANAGIWAKSSIEVSPGTSCTFGYGV